jgi:hypothetical protein
MSGLTNLEAYEAMLQTSSSIRFKNKPYNIYRAWRKPYNDSVVAPAATDTHATDEVARLDAELATIVLCSGCQALANGRLFK